MSNPDLLFQWAKETRPEDIQALAFHLGSQGKPAHGDLYCMNAYDLAQRVKELTLPLLENIMIPHFDTTMKARNLPSHAHLKNNCSEDELSRLIIRGLFSTQVTNHSSFIDLSYFNTACLKLSKQKTATLGDYVGIVRADEEVYMNDLNDTGAWEDDHYIVCADALKGAGYTFDTTGEVSVATPPKNDLFS